MRQRGDHGVDLYEKFTCVMQSRLVLLLHSTLPDKFVDELDSRIIGEHLAQIVLLPV